MLCPFCSSEALKVLHTDSKNEKVIVTELKLGTDHQIHPERVQVSATRRKTKCLSCGTIFWTVEHFEKLTQSKENRWTRSVPQYDWGSVLTDKPITFIPAEPIDEAEIPLDEDTKNLILTTLRDRYGATIEGERPKIKLHLNLGGQSNEDK